MFSLESIVRCFATCYLGQFVIMFIMESFRCAYVPLLQWCRTLVERLALALVMIWCLFLVFIHYYWVWWAEWC